jgi:carboxypeptidase family protein
MSKSAACAVWLCLLAASRAFAQDPTGAIEGAVTDKTSSVIPGARVAAKHLETGFARDAVAGIDGFYRLTSLPVGPYSVTVEAPQFAKVVQQPVHVNVSQTLRVDVQLTLSAVNEAVTVTGRVQLVDSSTNALGRVVTGREIVDLPLNGRNFTQLGLLQTGVAPLTAGVATAGGSLRQGQAYAVNGMRPEQNVYLVDGAQNMNRMDGGYALKLPVDAIAEFRILTQSAPAPAARRRVSSRARAAINTAAVSTSSSGTTRSTRGTFSPNGSSRSSRISSAARQGGRFERTARSSSPTTRVSATRKGRRPAQPCRQRRSGTETFRGWGDRCSTWRLEVCRSRATGFPKPRSTLSHSTC